MKSLIPSTILSTLLLAGLSAWAQADLHLEADGTFAFAKPGDGTRSYLRTARSDYAKENFRAEVSVTLNGGGGAGCAFFGMGCGQGNAKQYQGFSTKPLTDDALKAAGFGESFTNDPTAGTWLPTAASAKPSADI